MLRVAITSLAAVLAMPAPAGAHHGWSEYDATRVLTLTGVIKESGYEHPHGHVVLEASGKLWHVVLAPPSRMENRGLPQDEPQARQQGDGGRAIPTAASPTKRGPSASPRTARPSSCGSRRDACDGRRRGHQRAGRDRALGPGDRHAPGAVALSVDRDPAHPGFRHARRARSPCSTCACWACRGSCRCGGSPGTCCPGPWARCSSSCRPDCSCSWRTPPISSATALSS